MSASLDDILRLYLKLAGMSEKDTIGAGAQGHAIQLTPELASMLGKRVHNGELGSEIRN